jgi:hypothetical protein
MRGFAMAGDQGPLAGAISAFQGALRGWRTRSAEHQSQEGAAVCSCAAAGTSAKAILVLSLALLVGWGLPAVAAPVVWVEPSLARVGPDAPAGSHTAIELHAAKGEYESFQIIVQAPAGGLTNVNVAVPDADEVEFTLYREHYVYLARGSADWATNQNSPLGGGWYPDGLIPFVDPATGEDLSGAELDAVPFDLAAGKNQPVWVDVLVRREAPAGEYTGTLVVTSDQGEATVTLDLTVWNFELPVTPALDSAFLYWTVGGQLQPKQELLRNRIMPTNASSSHANTLVSEGLGAVNIGFWSGADGSTCSVSNPPPSATAVASAAAAYPDGLRLYAYTADEISHCSGLLPTMEAYADALHEAGVDQLITMPPNSDWAGVVDIWVELPKQYDVADVEDAIERGEAVWSYNCLQQDDYSPKWLLDYAPINYRIQPGFINQSLGLSGLLYWRADHWTADPWNDVTRYSVSYPGEGLLVYPAEQVGLEGVVPSMRLKWLRDGVDDYDYVQILKGRGDGDWALGIAQAVGPDWINWIRDPSALESARRQLGERIVDLDAPHSLEVTVSASPGVVPSEGIVSLDAAAVDGLGHGIGAWTWSDNGAGGIFLPSAAMQSPAYYAPANTSGSDLSIELTATATCAGAEPLAASDTATVTVQSTPHLLSVTATASPGSVPSGGTTMLSASASDTHGHSVTSWHWDDGDAGGTFYPSRDVQYPSYTAPSNTSEVELEVFLSVTVTCAASTPITASAETSVTVVPGGEAPAVEAQQPTPSVVDSEGVASLSATLSGDVIEGEVAWHWHDGEAGGTFLPSLGVRSPLYQAPRNTTGQPLEVALTVAANREGPAAVLHDSTSITVEPAEHALTIHAYVDPSAIGWKGKAQLTASTDDTFGHAVADWHWSDGGAGGSFSPSALVPDPIYRPLPNTTLEEQVVTLAVTATCDGAAPASNSASAILLVQPKPNVKARTARVSRTAVRDGETTLLIADALERSTVRAAFCDVPEDFWAAGAIAACRDAGIIVGYDLESYGPDLPISRAEIAVYIARALSGGDGALPPGPAEASFRDVSAQHWARRHVEYVRAAGIVTGFRDGTYRPGENVTRAQMAAFVARSVVDPAGDEGLRTYSPPLCATFTDVQPTLWAFSYVEYLAAAGIAVGYEDGTYRPHSVCTRAETVVYLARAFGLGD